MADSKSSISTMLASEGPYDPGRKSDPGGETVWGIDYANNKGETKIWERLAWLKSQGSDFPSNVRTDAMMLALVWDYYERLFSTLGLLDMRDQKLAEAFFGAYHNQGPKVVSWLQGCLNALNWLEGNTQPPDLKEDGLMGPGTVDRANEISAMSPVHLLEAFNAQRVVGFITSAKLFPVRRENTKGLINRVRKGG